MGMLSDKLLAYERLLIAETLRACDGHRGRAASALGICTVTLYRKTRQENDLDASEDEPLAWAVRREGDRVAYGACWTREEIEAEAVSTTTIAVVLDRGQALALERDINTALAIGAAARASSSATMQMREDEAYVY